MLYMSAYGDSIVTTIENELHRIGYKETDFKTGIHNVAIMAYLYFDGGCGEYYPEYGDEFTIEGLSQYVEDIGGWKEFDHEV